MTANHVLSLSALLQLVTYVLVANSQIYAQDLVCVDLAKVLPSESIAVYWAKPVSDQKEEDEDDDDDRVLKEKYTVTIIGYNELTPAQRERLASAAKFLTLGDHLRLREVHSHYAKAELRHTRLALHSPKETSGRLEFKVSATMQLKVPTAPFLFASNRVGETWELSKDGILQMRQKATDWGFISL